MRVEHNTIEDIQDEIFELVESIQREFLIEVKEADLSHQFGLAKNDVAEDHHAKKANDAQERKMKKTKQIMNIIENIMIG